MKIKATKAFWKFRADWEALQRFKIKDIRESWRRYRRRMLNAGLTP